MPGEPAGTGAGVGVGLCHRCVWMRRIRSHRSSVFYLCGRHRRDPTFPKYPPLPVLQCRGFDPNPQDEPE